MKNQLFGKQLTALVMGSLMIFSSQALAFSSDNQEVRNTGILGNSELLIAQCMSAECQSEPVEPEERIALAESIAIAHSAVEDALAAVTLASSFPIQIKNAIARPLSEVMTILDNAMALLQSTPLMRGDVAAIAQSVAVAESLIGQATFIYVGVGGEAAEIAQSIALAESLIDYALAIAQSVAAAESLTGAAAAIAQSLAISEEEQSVAQSIAQAEIALAEIGREIGRMEGMAAVAR